MDAATARKILVQHEPAELYEVVQPLLKYRNLRDELVEGSFAKNETYRYNCVRVLFRVMNLRPELFYPYWGKFAEGLDSRNGFHRSVGAQAIAFLASVDKESKLDAIFNRYLTLIDDSKVMVSHYFLETLPLIYHARPGLRTKIVTCLLNFEKTKHPPSRKEMLKADVISNINRIYETLSQKDKNRAASFVKSQLKSSSPKARRMAKEFEAKLKEESV